MKYLRWIFVLFIVSHLLILTLGMLPVRVWSPHFVNYVLAPYSRLTGAGASYGFFSPNVGNQLLVTFVATDINNNKKDVRLEDCCATPEAAVRIGNMYRLVNTVYSSERLRRATIASLVTPIFNSDPSVKEVEAKIDLYEVPSLWQIPRGHEVVTRPLYAARFKRRG